VSPSFNCRAARCPAFFFAEIATTTYDGYVAFGGRFLQFVVGKIKLNSILTNNIGMLPQVKSAGHPWHDRCNTQQ
jgi:hypothetical protein